MATTASQLVLAAVDEGVLTLTLNRPEKLNALSPELMDELADALRRASDDGVRCVVLTGSGRAFSAGGDVYANAGAPDRDLRRILHDHYAPVIREMRNLEKPVIASVNGVAAGAGMSLALAADFRIATQSAYFFQAFVRIGLIPDAGSTFFLPRLVGTARALELAMLGDRVSADEALRLGLVNRVAPDAELTTATRELAQRLARGPRALGLIKRAINLSLTSDLATQLTNEEDLQGLAAASEDFQEGATAFVEKREPRFQGR
jgi:2-(1,2-epoxy-1,2-dihydrophenyl)acetyl-CoA isomerase